MIDFWKTTWQGLKILSLLLAALIVGLICAIVALVTLIALIYGATTILGNWLTLILMIILNVIAFCYKLGKGDL